MNIKFRIRKNVNFVKVVLILSIKAFSKDENFKYLDNSIYPEYAYVNNNINIVMPLNHTGLKSLENSGSVLVGYVEYLAEITNNLAKKLDVHLQRENSNKLDYSLVKGENGSAIGKTIDNNKPTVPVSNLGTALNDIRNNFTKDVLVEGMGPSEALEINGKTMTFPNALTVPASELENNVESVEVNGKQVQRFRSPFGTHVKVNQRVNDGFTLDGYTISKNLINTSYTNSIKPMTVTTQYFVPDQDNKGKFISAEQAFFDTQYNAIISSARREKENLKTVIKDAATKVFWEKANEEQIKNFNSFIKRSRAVPKYVMITNLVKKVTQKEIEGFQKENLFFEILKPENPEYDIIHNTYGTTEANVLKKDEQYVSYNVKFVTNSNMNQADRAIINKGTDSGKTYPKDAAPVSNSITVVNPNKIPTQNDVDVIGLYGVAKGLRLTGNVKTVTHIVDTYKPYQVGDTNYEDYYTPEQLAERFNDYSIKRFDNKVDKLTPSFWNPVLVVKQQDGRYATMSTKDEQGNSLNINEVNKKGFLDYNQDSIRQNDEFEVVGKIGLFGALEKHSAMGIGNFATQALYAGAIGMPLGIIGGVTNVLRVFNSDIINETDNIVDSSSSRLSMDSTNSTTFDSRWWYDVISQGIGQLLAVAAIGWICAYKGAKTTTIRIVIISILSCVWLMKIFN